VYFPAQHNISQIDVNLSWIIGCQLEVYGMSNILWQNHKDNEDAAKLDSEEEIIYHSLYS